jgi:hypothetical protein
MANPNTSIEQVSYAKLKDVLNSNDSVEYMTQMDKRREYLLTLYDNLKTKNIAGINLKINDGINEARYIVMTIQIIGTPRTITLYVGPDFSAYSWLQAQFTEGSVTKNITLNNEDEVISEINKCLTKDA